MALAKSKEIIRDPRMLNGYFERKYELTKKINHNNKVVFQIAKAIESETDYSEAVKLKKLHAEYRRALKAQIKERQKYSFPRMARQFGFRSHKPISNWYRKFLKDKE